MKRLLAAGLFVLGLATAGLCSGTVIADVTTSTSTSTVATTTSTVPATTTAPGTTTSTTPPAPPPSRAVIPAGVRVAGIAVGGLSPKEAVAAVSLSLARPVTLVVDTTTFQLDPRVYTSAYVQTAVARARVAPAGTRVRVVVSVRGAAVRALAAKLARRFTHTAVDAKLAYRGERPVVTGDRPGHSLAKTALTRKLVAALASGTRTPVRVHTRTTAPAVTAKSFGAVIVIDRARNRLMLYDGAHLVRTFAVATGQSIYPTPHGDFTIVVKQANPWWYPPTYDSWAKGLSPVPPGPDNPLGTRWMGLSVPGVGIHGTDEPTSIGYSESHGCIRMQIPDAEWLFNHVSVGTPVHIV